MRNFFKGARAWWPSAFWALILLGAMPACTRKDVVLLRVNAERGEWLNICVLGRVTHVSGLERAPSADTARIRVTDSLIRIEGQIQGLLLPGPSALLDSGQQESAARIEAIDLSSAESMAYLSCEGASLPRLDLTANPFLEFLSLDGTTLRDPLTLRGNPNLVDLRLEGCALERLDLSANPKLRYAILDGNHFESIDTRACLELELLSIAGSSIRELDLRGNPRLRWLWCAQNDLSELDLSMCPALELLDCSRNRIRALDLSLCQNLVEISVHTNIMRDQGMRDLIGSLPQVRAGKLAPVLQGKFYDMNELSDTLRAQAQARGWRVVAPEAITPVRALFAR